MHSVLADAVVRHQAQDRLLLPRLGEDLGILHRHVVDDRVEGVAPVALGDAQLLAVNRADAGQPGVGVEAHHVHHQRVAFPVRHRVAQVGRLVVVGVGAAVGRDDAERVVHLVEDEDAVAQLDDLERQRPDRDAWDAREQALRHRVVHAAAIQEVLAPRGRLRLVGRRFLLERRDASRRRRPCESPRPPVRRAAARNRRRATRPTGPACRRQCAESAARPAARRTRAGAPHTRPRSSRRASAPLAVPRMLQAAGPSRRAHPQLAAVGERHLTPGAVGRLEPRAPAGDRDLGADFQA